MKCNNAPCLGLWTLSKALYIQEQGQEAYPLGRNPSGYLSYFPTGQVMVQINGTEPPADTAKTAGKDDIYIRTPHGGTHYAYHGRFEMSQDGREVLHYISSCSNGYSSGTTVRRTAEVDGDTLRLRTEPFLYGGRTIQGHLLWQRVK